MGRYASSTFRILMLAVLAGAVWLAATSYGQAPPTPAPAAAVPSPEPQHRGIGSLVMDNRDFVFFTIIGCSVAAMTFIIQGFIKVRRAVLIPDASTNRIREMIAARQFRELIDFTDADPSFVSKALNPALKRAGDFARAKDAMETAIGEQTAEQFRRIEYLNIIGNLGPLLGLLGTVLGMIDAFNTLGAAGGEATPAQLAPGISKALTHTMLGLMLAIPCLAAFGILRTMVDRITVQGAMIAEELLMMIKPAEAKPLTATPIGPAPARAPAVARAASFGNDM
jgi:biopolymer transport protein ExbB